jgi:hypothetical protein
MPAGFLLAEPLGCGLVLFARMGLPGNIRGGAQQCLDQSAECRRLVKLAESEAEAQLLKNLSRAWLGLAGQIDRYKRLCVNISASSDLPTAHERGRDVQALPSSISIIDPRGRLAYRSGGEGSTMDLDAPPGAGCIPGGVPPCGLSAGAPSEPVSSGPVHP